MPFFCIQPEPKKNHTKYTSSTEFPNWIVSFFAHFSSLHSIIQYLSHNIQYLLYYTVVIWIIIACFANSLVLETRMRVDSLEASWCRGKKRSHTKFMLNTLVMEADFIIGS